MTKKLVPLLLLALLAPAAAASAQEVPSERVLYEDGHTNRYLMDGQWLFRLDPAQRGPQRGLHARDEHRGVEPDDGAERLERRRRDARLDAGRHRLVPQGLQAAVLERPVRLDPALRVGQLPHPRVAERQADRPEPRRLPAVRAADPARRAAPRRHEPPRGARRQRAPQLRPPARRPQPHRRADRRLVELRRDHARGLPAQGRPRGGRDRPGPARGLLPHVRGDGHRARDGAQPEHLDPARRPLRALRRPALQLRQAARLPGPLRDVHRRDPRRQPAAVVARAPVAVLDLVRGERGGPERRGLPRSRAASARSRSSTAA